MSVHVFPGKLDKIRRRHANSIAVWSHQRPVPEDFTPHREAIHIPRPYNADLDLCPQSNSTSGTNDDDTHPTSQMELYQADEATRQLAAEQTSEPMTFLPTTIEESIVETPTFSSATLIPTCGSRTHSFWRYKTQPKGPKATNFNVQIEETDAHQPIVFVDPASDSSASWRSDSSRNPFTSKIYRVGDGNDLTPSPAKLSALGVKVKAVQAQMDRLGDNPADRNLKRKLISRICRLKKNANHEANKLIFAGLGKEREELSRIIKDLRSEMKTENPPPGGLVEYCGALQRANYRTIVAGETEAYVNNLLEDMGDNSESDKCDSSDELDCG